MKYRTHYCGNLGACNNQESVTLSGWVDRIREVGGVTFILLRDQSGIVQLIIDASIRPELHETFTKLNHEDIVRIEGAVRLRSDKDINPHMPTGTIEIEVESFKLLSKSKTLPVNVHHSEEVDENLRLKYRYIDLRNPQVRQPFILKHRVMQSTREYFTTEGYIEIETPYLAKSTPEGARDFLVPSRIHPGYFYALTQSPQIYKQLIVMGGIEKYFQICRCFRDEDFRLDRQPEFSQIDFESAFISLPELKILIEGLMKKIFKEALDIELSIPFTELSYDEAMTQYGTDKPDLRNPLKIANITSIFHQPACSPFYEKINDGNIFLGIRLPSSHFSFSRKQTDELIASWQNNDAKIYFFKHKEQGFSINGLGSENQNKLEVLFDSKHSDTVVAVLGSKSIAYSLAGKIRQDLGQTMLNQEERDAFHFSWINDFPLFEWNPSDNRYQSSHHLFTQPNMEDYEKWNKEAPEKIRSASFDLVLNGFELGSGGLRIFNSILQKEVLNILGFNNDTIAEQFGFFLDAMDYGAPPSGGFAIGLDRLAMIISRKSSLRDVMVFPKNTRGISYITGEPTAVGQDQLNDLKIVIIKEEK